MDKKIMRREARKKGKGESFEEGEEEDIELGE